MLEAVLKHARRRLILNIGIEVLAASSALYVGLFILLLIAGTRFLNWPTLACLMIVLPLAEIFRVYRAVPDLHASATRLDKHAGLQDALSTALHFSSDRQMRLFTAPQRREAERIAGAVNVSAAIPMKAPRSLHILAGLVVVAASLVAFRYGILHTLDLRRPITEVFFEDQAAKRPGDSRRVEGDALHRKRLDDAEALLAKMGLPANPDDDHRPDELDQAIEDALQSPAGGVAAKGQKSDGNGKSAEQSPAGDPMDNPGNDREESGESASGKDSPGDQKGNSKPGGGGDNAGLLSRLKDAVSNMLSKASQGSDKGQNPSGQQAKGGKSDKGKADKSGGKTQNSSESADAQDGEPNGDAQEGQQAQGKAAAKGSQQSAQAGSGMGSQDGLKELRAAEQLKAMGKISEIIGKRSASVSGETTIEVQSGNQQLRTAYSKTAASHAQSDGDVTRDEIPVALQPYVRQYFEQVRKTATGRKTP